MNSNDVTVTDSYFNRVVSNAINKNVTQSVPPLINEALTSVQIYSCIMTKFYPYLDKAEVQFSDGSLKVCTILHRFGGDMVDFYTPIGEDSFCDNLKEPCIIPMCELTCFVAPIVDGSEEYLLLGYDLEDEIVGYDPAEKGNFKLMSSGISNEYWLKFNSNGVDIRSQKETTTNIGSLEDEMVAVEYPSKAEIESLIQEAVESIVIDATGISPDTVYTKEEIDEIISNLSFDIPTSEFYTKLEVNDFVDSLTDEITRKLRTHNTDSSAHSDIRASIPSVIDNVVNGNNNAVTSNAVYDYVNDLIGDIDEYIER